MAPLDPGAQAYVDVANAAPPIWEVSVEDARRGIDAETLAAFGPVDDVEAVDRTIDGPGGPIRVRVYGAGDDASRPALVYLHGGGWVVGSVESHDPVCRRLARRAPCVVVSVDYRLAPEHPFPAGLEDAWAATEWTAAHLGELGADRVAVGGDSAGGNLAAVVALRARDLGLPIALQILIYPVIDGDLDSPGYREQGEGLNLTRAKMAWYWERYTHGADPLQPETSPLRARDLSGVAPALVQTAEYDPLRDEGEAYARALEEAGVPATLTRYDGQIHGFVRLGALCPRAYDALAEIEAALSAR
jgi:acetyl esterase